ncbi:type iii secretion system substrate exporter [Lucifera butyrica]|uniref:Flagellar biosynthetic protein FlhB n=1 Tax=Lucifera butyrica TaxID=1351585 RepID=A0A498RA97_9FIRM|nr:flagellar biosynthesis protein FlhB [Lucifera butyrica]VBB08079.1 type iii secretion system substrate exporter [Lucifera butyrica]
MACTGMYTIFWQSLHRKKNFQFQGFDLQLFNGEKTEEPTSKRKNEAREKGQVAKSSEINATFIILTAFLVLKIAGGYIYENLTAYMGYMFSQLAVHDFSNEGLQTLFLQFALVFVKAVFPVMITILVIAVAINVLQVGFVFSTEGLMPDLGRINPLNGFQRLFSKRSLVELVKSLFKVLIIGYFIYSFIYKEIGQLAALINFGLRDSLSTMAALTLDLVFQIGAVMIVLSALDYFYQWWENKQSLKMSKEEVKEEFKQTEGNPQIKGKIKERQRALAMRRMMQEVPKADVIVTNPTHFAVALKYEKKMTAPMVIAKGQDFLAVRIKEIGREHRVIVVENKPLARALYASTEVGEVIPAELYQAVAEVLAYVYKLKRRLS